MSRETERLKLEAIKLKADKEATLSEAKEKPVSKIDSKFFYVKKTYFCS